MPVSMIAISDASGYEGLSLTCSNLVADMFAPIEAEMTKLTEQAVNHLAGVLRFGGIDVERKYLL
jgi:hypothetical protein